MSGNNPNILYSLNVLGNATVQGILDCTEIAIDTIDTENITCDSIIVSGAASATSLNATNFLKSSGGWTVSAGTGSIISFDAGNSDQTYFVNQKGAGAGGFAWIGYDSGGNVLGTPMSLTSAGALSVGSSVSCASANLSGLTVSRPVSTDASKNLVSASITGTGVTVLATSPTLVTPVIGAATGTSLALSNFSKHAGGWTPSAGTGSILSFDVVNDQNLYINQKGLGAGGYAWLQFDDAANLLGTQMTLSSSGNLAVSGKITSVPNCYTYLASTTTAITAGIPTNMLHWGVNGAAANSGDALTYDNATGRFTNSLGRTVLAIITMTARTDVVAGTLTASLQSSSLSGAASVNTVQLGDFVSLSASIVMGNGAYVSLQGIVSSNATWQDTGACITVTLF